MAEEATRAHVQRMRVEEEARQEVHRAQEASRAELMAREEEVCLRGRGLGGCDSG